MFTALGCDGCLPGAHEKEASKEGQKEKENKVMLNWT